LVPFSFLDGLLESHNLSARGSPSAACSFEKMGWWIECLTPPTICQGERLQPRTPLHRHMWTISWKCPVWCVQVMLYEKQLSYDVHVVWYTYHTTPQATLYAWVQDAAHQALIAFCQELQDLTASGLVKWKRSTCRRLRIFKHGSEFMRGRFKYCKLWASPRRVSSEVCEDSYRKLVKMWMMIKTTRTWMIIMWRTTSTLEKTSRVQELC
jgi:hypothetical protein